MNIFVLDNDPYVAATMHCDKHVVKMIVESTQLLSTAHRLIDGKETIVQKQVAKSNPPRFRNVKRWVLPDYRENLLYSATHINHPCAIWVRESVPNYKWQWDLLNALCEEYRFRYGEHKVHKVQRTGLLTLLQQPPNLLRLSTKGLTPFAQAMPDQYKNSDVVAAYRAYYLGEKTRLLKYKNRAVPSWI